MKPCIKTLRLLLVCLVLMCFGTCILRAQEVSGKVYDAVTKAPIIGASVYYDGSTLGVVTNANGRFKISPKYRTSATLVISHIGYQTHKIVPRNLDASVPLDISMVEAIEAIPEVVVTSDPFSRAKKMAIYKKEFLGRTKAGKSAEILNEDVIQLRYSTKDKVLYAYASRPLLIKNAYLGYTVTFGLEEFRASYRKTTLDPDFLKLTHFFGTTFFKDDAPDDARISKRRENAYMGSPLHFMRTCSTQSWNGQQFKLYKKIEKLDPFKVVDVIKDTLTGAQKVTFKHNALAIGFKNSFKLQSSLHLIKTDHFFVDDYGNHFPYGKVVFGGYMARLRVGDLLPIDYGL